MATPVFDTAVFDRAMVGGGAELFDPVPMDPAMFDVGRVTASARSARAPADER